MSDTLGLALPACPTCYSRIWGVLGLRDISKGGWAMKLYFTRRNFFSTGITALVAARELRSQSEAIPVAGVPVKAYGPRSTVALTHSGDRRKNVYDALMAINDQILPKLKTKKRVLIKPNNVADILRSEEHTSELQSLRHL